jgi:hypothetical protein
MSMFNLEIKLRVSVTKPPTKRKPPPFAFFGEGRSVLIHAAVGTLLAVALTHLNAQDAAPLAAEVLKRLLLSL